MEKEIGGILARLDALQKQMGDADTRAEARSNESERKAEQSRRLMHEKIDTYGKDIAVMKAMHEHMRTDIDMLKGESADTRSMRDRLRGAGNLGKALWLVGGALAGAAAWWTGFLHDIFGPNPPHR